MKKTLLLSALLIFLSVHSHSDTSWNFFTGMTNQTLRQAPASASNAATLAFDSAYTYNSAGDAVYLAFVPQDTGTLTDFQIKVSTFNGTWANTDGVINVEVREGSNGSNIPGNILTGNFTITLDGTTLGWIHKTGISITMESGRYYAIVIGDADGNASDFVTLTYRLGTGASSIISGRMNTATNGFATAGTNQSGSAAMAWKIGSAWYGGQGYDAIGTVSLGTAERGVRFRPKENCTVVGVYIPNDTTLLANNYTSTHSWVLYADATSPGGTPLTRYQMTPSSYTGTSPFYDSLQFPTTGQYTLTKNTWYRFVYRPGSTSTTPRKATIGGSPDADLLTAMQPNGGDFYWTDGVGGVWTDDTASAPTIAPILVPNTDSADGGTGGVFMYAN